MGVGDTFLCIGYSLYGVIGIARARARARERERERERDHHRDHISDDDAYFTAHYDDFRPQHVLRTLYRNIMVRRAGQPAAIHSLHRSRSTRYPVVVTLSLSHNSQYLSRQYVYIFLLSCLRRESLIASMAATATSPPATQKDRVTTEGRGSGAVVRRIIVTKKSRRCRARCSTLVS